MQDVFNSSLLDAYGYIISFLIDMFLELIPILAPFIGIELSIALFKYFTTPKAEVFGKDFEDEFNLMYDTFSDQYDSEEDFINEFFSLSKEEKEDNDFDLDFWDNVTDVRYYDNETEYFDVVDDKYSISFDEYEGTYIDYVENSENE